jgi:hypothetical protein
MHRRIPGIAMVFDINGKLALKKATHLGLAQQGWEFGKPIASGCPPHKPARLSRGAVRRGAHGKQNRREFKKFRVWREI